MVARVSALLLTLSCVGDLLGAGPSVSSAPYASRFRFFTSDPATCAKGSVGFNLTTNIFKGCNPANTWGAFTIGGYAPGGTDVAVADGGTGLSTLTANNVILGNGTAAPLFVAPGTSGNVLTSNGTTWTSAAAASSGGDVVGPASSTDNAIARYNLATGKLLQDSLAVVSDVGSLVIPAGALLDIGGDRYRWSAGVGPSFNDQNAGVQLIFDVQSLSANRIITWPDAAGTAALETSNVASATALAANPTDCAAGQFATTIAASGNLTCAVPLAVGNCTLDGAATATCTATVPSGCTPVCSYNSASTPRSLGCAVSDTTLTAVSSLTLDVGVVNYHCY